MKSSFSISRRGFNKASAAIAIGAAATSMGMRAASAEDNIVVFVTWGGAIMSAERKVFLDSFEKETGIKVIETPDPSLAKLKTMAETGNAEWDLVQADEKWLPQVVSSGSLWEPLDYSVLNADGVPDALKNEYGVGVQTFGITLGYNTNSFEAGKGPASWADLFDLKKFPGKRGMSSSPQYTLEVALMSDGVAKEDLYPLDVERALKRLDQIKDDIVWWDKWPQGANLLASGEFVASMTSDASVQKLLAQDPSTPIYQVWNAPGIMTSDFLAIPRGAKHRANAEKLIAWMLDAKRQAEFAKVSRIGPSNAKAMDELDASIRDQLPTQHLIKNEMVPIGALYWADQVAPLTERFNAWKLGN